MTLRPRHPRVGGWLLAFCSLALSGCDSIKTSDFFARHFRQEDQKAVARKRWDDFRGNVRIQMAEQHLKSGRFDEAAKVLAEAREIMPDVPEVLRLSAELHCETGELTKARTEIEEYMARVPDDVKGRELGGRIAMRAGRIDDAVMWYHSAIELAPDEASYRQRLAECLMARGNGAEALSVIEQATEFDISLPLRRLAMEICDARGDRDGAIRHARAVAEMAAGDESVRERAGVILANSGAYEDAIAILEPIVHEHVDGRKTYKLDGNDAKPERPVEALHAFAKSCLEINRDEEAMGVLKVAIRDDPSDQVTWSLYCRAAIRSGDLHKALDIVATFNQRNDPIPEMLVLEAYVHLMLGDKAEAQRVADRALKIDPGFEPAFILKAKASHDSRERRPVEDRREPLPSAVTAAPEVNGVSDDVPGQAEDYGRQWYLNPRVTDTRVAVVEEDVGR